MRTVVITAWGRPHVTDAGALCWCKPTSCGEHWHHKDVDLMMGQHRLYMSSFSEQRERR